MMDGPSSKENTVCASEQKPGFSQELLKGGLFETF
jgi:hypothetical protein